MLLSSYKGMGVMFWICTISVVCIVGGVIYYKPYLGIAFVIISIPFEGHIITDDISIYPIEVVLAIHICVCLYRLVVCRENYFRNTKMVYYYLPFVLCILLSVLKSMEFSLSVKEVVRWLELIIIYFLTINLINDNKKLRVILYTMALATVMVSICGIIGYLNDVRSSIPGWEQWDHRAVSPFGGPNALAGYVNLIIPVLIGMLLASVLLWERIVLGFCAMLSIITCFLTISRTGWLSLLLAIITIFILAKQKKRVAAFSVMFFIVLIIIFFSLTIRDSFMDRLVLHAALAGIGGRAECYSIGFKMVKDDLIFGIGAGNYPILIKKFTTVRQFVQNNLHNLYLQIFVETGLVGLCAFAFWLTGILRFLSSSLKSLENSRNYGLYVGLIGGIIAYLFANLANVLTVHGIHLQWGIILGLAVVLVQFRESEKCPEMV